MAQKSSASTRKRTTTAKKNTKAVSEAKRIQKHRMWSTVLSIVGVFLIFLTWLKGESLWNSMQMILWGLFGISAAIVAPIVIYVAIMLALDKSKSAVVVKLVQGLLLILLVSPMFEIIYGFTSKTGAFVGEDFTAKLTNLYQNGSVNHQGGGALSIFLGGALTGLCGEVCALIIIILLILLFVMLLTNITFVDVFRRISIWISRLKASLSESSEEAAIKRLEREEARRRQLEEEAAREKDRRVDIAKFITDDMPAHTTETKPDDDADKKSRKKRKGERMPADFIMPDEPEKPAEAAAPAVEEPAVTPVPAPAPVSEEPIQEKPIHAEEPKEIPPLRVAEPTSKLDDAKLKPAEAEAVPAGEDDSVNPIYVEKDGQTTLIEMDDADVSGYSVPPIELLNPASRAVESDDLLMETDKNAETLVDTLKSFGVVTRIVGIHRGPSVTRYELQPAAGVKVSRITSLADDIALNLAANGVRIEAPIPGKAAVGIELANKVRETVCIRELIDSDEFRNANSKLSFPVGRDIEGKIIVGDISKMPHILIAGTTGSGKSVFTNSIIMSILYNASPDEVKLILVDPKQVEFPVYNGIPHLLIPVVTEAKKAAGALGWAVTEMLKRYKLFADNGVRDLKDYNKMAKDSDVLTPIPQIVIVVDELADLMMAAPKEVEDSICRLAQLARAAGMHLIIATQSPRVDIVTGLIKANIPSRVALKVSNQMDSRVILDEGGAEKLLGNGDLLYKPVGLGKPVRVQGSYVATEEIKRVVDFLKAQTSSQYDEEVASEVEKHIPVAKGEKPAQEASSESSSENNMTERAIEVVVEAGQASTSYLQRRLKLGYARAARIMDELEEMGIVGPADGAKPREVRLTRSQWLERKNSMLNESANTGSGEDIL